MEETFKPNWLPIFAGGLLVVAALFRFRKVSRKRQVVACRPQLLPSKGLFLEETWRPFDDWTDIVFVTALMPGHDVSDRRQHAIGLTAAIVIDYVVQQIVDVATADFEKLTREIDSLFLAKLKAYRLQI